MSHGQDRGPRTDDTSPQQGTGQQSSRNERDRGSPSDRSRTADAGHQPPDRTSRAGQQSPGGAGRQGAGSGRSGNSGRRGGPRDPGHGTSPSRAAGGGTVPTTLRIVSVALVVFGVPSLLVGIRAMQAGQSAAPYDPTGGSSAITLVGLLSAALGAGYLAAAYGTWTLRPWGWKLAVTLFGIGTLSSFVLLTGDLAGPGLFGLLLNGGLGWYLYSNRSLYRRLAGV